MELPQSVLKNSKVLRVKHLLEVVLCNELNSKFSAMENRFCKNNMQIMKDLPNIYIYIVYQ